MKYKLHLILLVAAGILATATSTFAQPDASALKYGLYIHYGITTFIKPGQQGKVPASQFAPTSVNVKSWPHAAKEAGMTFAVLTAKHESGFCLWPSEGYDYDVAGSLFKGDIIRDFIAACNAEGILPGVHYSIPDAHNEGVARSKGPVPGLYFDVIKKQITELHTKYPELRIQIFDGSERLTAVQWNELRQIVHRLNPQCVILNWQKRDGAIIAAANTVPKGWMFRGNDQLNAAGQLFQSYSRAQAANKAFVLNVGPGPLGNIPANQMAVLMQIKQMIANPPADLTSTPAAAPAAKPDAAARLKQVKDLYDQGLINKDEYDQKVKEIMDSL